MNVAYYLTRNLYPYLLPSVMSLLDHNPKAKVYIFCEDDKLPYDVPKNCKVINVSNQEYIKRSSPNWNNWFSWMTVIRVCMSKFLPKVNKVLSIDIDTIVNDDLSEMYDMDMGENYFAMANESKGTYKPYGDKYFNAGVCLMNLKQIRKDHADDAMIELLNTRKLNYIDQDAMNIIGKGKIIDLPPRYNENRATENSDNPAIVHYVAIREHWKPGIPRAEFYQKYKKFERH